MQVASIPDGADSPEMESPSAPQAIATTVESAAQPATSDWIDELAREETPVANALDRDLPLLVSETLSYRMTWVVVAICICALYGSALRTYWAPADAGIDQNAYLLGGRMIAKHFTTRLDVPDKFTYIGGMFDRSVKGDFYPKYPFGLPLLYALFFWTLGSAHAFTWAFIVSPASMVIAVYGMFLLARQIAGSFPAALCAILLACSQVTLDLANNPNSHASCLAFVVWGMYVLLLWWQSGKLWLGILGGFLLGFAGTIRYSEGLLVLPIAVACASRLRWADWRSYLRCAAPGLAWAVPIATLLIYNKCTLGDWTGYDSTNESALGTAFTWTKLASTWEEMLRTLHDMGLFFVMPLGAAGLAMLFRRNWRLAILMLAWLLPGLTLYTAYYFSPDRGMAYARFFLTFFPPLLVGVAVCFRDGILSGKEVDAHPALSIPLDLAVGVVVAISAGVGVYRAANGLEGGQPSLRMDLADESRVRQNLAFTGQELFQHVPAGSVLFTEDAGFVESPINYIQFVQDWDLFSVSAFSPTGGRRGLFSRNGPFAGGGPGANGNQRVDVPRPMQARLGDYFAEIYKDKSYADLQREQKRVIDDALSSGRKVFIAGSAVHVQTIRDAVESAGGNYRFHVVDRWSDYPTIPVDLVSEPSAFGGPPGGLPGGPPPGGFGGGFGGGGFGGGGWRRNGMGGGGMGGGFGGRRGGPGMEAPIPINWQLVEITGEKSTNGHE
jgi:hypothetical protein